MIRRLLRWWPVVVVIIGVAASVVGQRLSASYKAKGVDGWSTFWFVVAVAGAVIAAVTAVAERLVRERRDLTAKQRQRVAYNDALDPLVESLAKLINMDPTQRATARGSYISQVLFTASQLVGKDKARVRASYFASSTREGKQELSCVESRGRSGSPSTVFREGERSGDAMLDLMRRDEHRICLDIDADPPPGWDASRQRDYKTFISMPARARTPAGRSAVSFGVLSVDAPDPGDLSSDDVPLVRVLSTLLAVAELLETTLTQDTPTG